MIWDGNETASHSRAGLLTIIRFATESLFALGRLRVVLRFSDEVGRNAAIQASSYG